MKIEHLLERVVQEQASDGFISAGARPSIKVDGEISPISDKPVSEEEARELVLSTMRPDQQETFLRHHECNYASPTRGWAASAPAPLSSAAARGLVVRHPD